MNELAWVGLSLVPQLGGQTLRRLLEAYDHNLDAILEASPDALMEVRGIGRTLAHAITTIDLPSLQTQMAQWHQAGIQWHDWKAPTYPPSLHERDDAPPLLFTRGDWGVFASERAGAIIGTRNPAPRVIAYAEDLGFSLAVLGMTVVSGLALGVDTSGHRGALAMPAGRTVAVLGGGVLNVYPPSNHHLAQAIMGRGAVISENAPRASATPPRLVARNRLISALAGHIFILETSDRGGAMYGASFARQQDRRIYTLDLPASGNQALISEGAQVIPPDVLSRPDSLASLMGL